MAGLDVEVGERASRLLSDVPLLEGVDDEAMDRLAELVDGVGLRAGESLFAAGDPGDALYLVVSGRLEAVSASGLVIRVIGPGGHVGELALLTGEPRAASVRARRDSLLLRLRREDFESLLRDPSFSEAVLRALGRQLRSVLPESSPTPLPGVIAVAGSCGAEAVRAIADGLCSRLEGFGSVALLRREDVPDDAGTTLRTRQAEALERAERARDRVLILVEDVASGDHWTSFALEQADRVALVGDLRADPPRGVGPGCDLLLYERGPTTGETSRWLAALEPRETYAVGSADPGLSSGLDRVARRLAGRSLGVVLSGGGARGLAHIGALDALEEAGLVVDRIGGCSMGALVGGLYACGRSPGEIAAICREELVEGRPMRDYTLPVAGLIRRGRAEAMLRRMFAQRQIEELPLGYYCVSADLVSGELIEHTTGALLQAVGASICLPGISPPVPDGDRLLIDGGILNNLPVERMAATGEGPVVAVDVTAQYEPRLRPTSRRPRIQEMRGHLRKLVIGEQQPLPRLPETLFRTLVLGSIDTSEVADRHADLVIEPEVSGHGLTDFGRIDRLIAAGREATERVIQVRGDDALAGMGLG